MIACIHMSARYTLKHASMCRPTQTYTLIVTDKAVARAGAVPSCLFDRRLNRISRNNGALNLLHVPWRIPERGGGVRGRRFSLIYVGSLGLHHDPASTGLSISW